MLSSFGPMCAMSLRVDRRQQAQDHDQQEQDAEDQRDLVAPQPAPSEALRPDPGGSSARLAGSSARGISVGELGAGCCGAGMPTDMRNSRRPGQACASRDRRGGDRPAVSIASTST